MNNFRLTVTLLFLGTLNASAQQEKSVQKEKSDPSKNVSEWLANSKSLKTFSKAFKVAGENSGGQNALESGSIPFTIFAPSDSALAKIDKEAKSDEEKIENTFLDRNELHTGYHIFYGEKLTSKKLMAMAKNKKFLENQVFGGKQQLSEKEGSIFIGGCKVTQADILCKGGVIHVIDGALKATR